VAHFDCGLEPYEIEVADYIKAPRGTGGALDDMANNGARVWLFETASNELVGFGSLGVTSWRWSNPKKGPWTPIQIIPFYGIQRPFRGQPLGPKSERYARRIFEHLLAACDDWLLVLRAEPLGFRTLPALLQLVRQTQATTTAGQLRGILLTTPPDGAVGNACERDLRGALGGRALPVTIPYDPEVGRALLLHQPVTQLNPRSPASQEYRRLATDLGLVQSATSTAVPVAR